MIGALAFLLLTASAVNAQSLQVVDASSRPGVTQRIAAWITVP